MPDAMRYRNDGVYKVSMTVSMDRKLLCVNLDRMLLALERALPDGVEYHRPELCEAIHTLRVGLSDLHSDRLIQREPTRRDRPVNRKFADLLISDEDAAAILKNER